MIIKNFITVVVIALMTLRAYVLITSPKTQNVATHSDLEKAIYNLNR